MYISFTFSYISLKVRVSIMFSSLASSIIAFVFEKYIQEKYPPISNENSYRNTLFIEDLSSIGVESISVILHFIPLMANF
jgi:hypothetical protein